MSIQQNLYILLGIRLTPMEAKKIQADKEPYQDDAFSGIQHHNQLCVIDDAYNGSYTFIGQVFYKSVSNEIEVPIMDLTSIYSNANVIQISRLIRKHFGIYYPEIKLWIFTHTR